LHDTKRVGFHRSSDVSRNRFPIGLAVGAAFCNTRLAVLPQPLQVLGAVLISNCGSQNSAQKERTPRRKHRHCESECGFEGIKAAGPPPLPKAVAGSMWGDRGSDIYEAMVAASRRRHDSSFASRRNSHRLGYAGTRSPGAFAGDFACTLPSQGSDVLGDIRPRGGRARPPAKVELTAATFGFQLHPRRLS